MKKDESLFTWSTTPFSYYLTRKYPTTSFVQIYSLLDYNLMIATGRVWKYDFEGNRKKLMNELTVNVPNYILVQINPEQIFDQLALFGDFSNFVFNNYVFDRQFGNLLIYKLSEKKIEFNDKPTFPLEIIKRFSAISNIKINNSKMEVEFEPMVNPNGILRSFKSVYPYFEEIKFFPLKIQLFEVGKEDLVGYIVNKPSGIPDLHIRAIGLPKPVNFVRLKIGNLSWNSKSYGVNAIIKILQKNDIFDLYLESVNIGSEKIVEIYFIYDDGSLSKSILNLN